jgi:sugar phosphate isomerase/epimerase
MQPHNIAINTQKAHTYLRAYFEHESICSPINVQAIKRKVQLIISTLPHHDSLADPTEKVRQEENVDYRRLLRKEINQRFDGESMKRCRM